VTLDSRDAELDLADAELLVFARGSIGYVKQLREQCLEADIPVMMGRCDAKG
jgi:hypothetical protein